MPKNTLICPSNLVTLKASKKPKKNSQFSNQDKASKFLRYWAKYNDYCFKTYCSFLHIENIPSFYQTQEKGVFTSK